jgi:tripartite-type tricarboxylate transporter receptor subunit TctC
MDKRQFLQTAGAAAAACMATPALWAAGSYPQRPIRLLVPFQAGSSPDTWGRAIGSILSTRLGQPVVVENMPGAGGTIGTVALKRAAPDGYTLGLLANTQAITVHTFQTPPYDLTADFVAVASIGGGASLLTVPATSPIRTAKDLIAALKAKPGELAYGSGGNGSIAHLATEQLLSDAGATALHVPYRGAPDIITSQLSGQTQFGMPILGSSMLFVRSGKLRPLAISSEKRSAFLPGVPTLAEALPPGFTLSSWSGFFAPARTPAPIVDRLHSEIRAILRSNQLDELAHSMGSDIQPMDSPAQFQQFVNAEDKRFAAQIKNIGLKVDGR